MIPPRLLPHVVEIAHPATVTNGYGEASYDYDPPAATRIIAARLEQVTARENTDNRDALIGEWRIITNDLTLTATDRLTCNGITFEVVGTPAQPAGGNGTVHHLEAQLRVVTG